MPFVPLLPTVPEPPAGKIRGNDTKEDHLEMWGQPEVGMADDQDQDEDQFNDGQVSKYPSFWFKIILFNIQNFSSFYEYVK